MPRKIGRNEPCPCGSGKKYKRCCLCEEKKGSGQTSSKLHVRIAEWVIGQPELAREFRKVLKKYVKGETLAETEFNNIMDAFIFDYKLSDGNTPFHCFLKSAKLSHDDYSACKSLGNNIYSIFEVREIFRGEGMKLHDLIGNGDYFVRERLGTYQTEPGNILFCRVASFKSHFIITTPAPHVWPQDMAYVVKRKLRTTRSALHKDGLSAFDILEILGNAEEKPGDLGDIKRTLKKKLDSLGIRIDFRGLDRRINEHTSVTGAFPEIFKFKFPSSDDFEETFDLLQLLWNKYPRREFGGKSPNKLDGRGPMEKSLSIDLLNESMRNVNPEHYSSMKEVEKALDVFKDKWVNTPQKELGGKTPMDVILDEREKRGDPRKDFSLRIEIQRSSLK